MSEIRDYNTSLVISAMFNVLTSLRFPGILLHVMSSPQHFCSLIDSSCAAAIFPSWEDGENKLFLLLM